MCVCSYLLVFGDFSGDIKDVSPEKGTLFLTTRERTHIAFKNINRRCDSAVKATAHCVRRRGGGLSDVGKHNYRAIRTAYGNNWTEYSSAFDLF